MDGIEEGEERGQVGGPVVAEDADVDCEGVGAEGEGVTAVRGCYCFAEFAQGSEDRGEFVYGEGEGFLGDRVVCGIGDVCQGRGERGSTGRLVLWGRVFREGERGEGRCELGVCGGC